MPCLGAGAPPDPLKSHAKRPFLWFWGWNCSIFFACGAPKGDFQHEKIDLYENTANCALNYTCRAAGAKKFSSRRRNLQKYELNERNLPSLPTKCRKVRTKKRSGFKRRDIGKSPLFRHRVTSRVTPFFRGLAKWLASFWTATRPFSNRDSRSDSPFPLRCTRLFHSVALRFEFSGTPKLHSAKTTFLIRNYFCMWLPWLHVWLPN